MDRARLTPARAADAAAVTELVAALESLLYGQTTFSQADLEDDWSDVDLKQDARVVRDGEWERGEHSIGLGADAASETGAFRLYERAGMVPALGWVIYEKQLGDPV
jgi:hypothetical protein